MKAAIYTTNTSDDLASAMHKGIRSSGDDATIYKEFKKITDDIAVFYGMSENHIHCLNAYRKENKHVVIIDLGYFGRSIDRSKDRSRMYFKISVDYWHPTAYFQNKQHKADRFDIFKQNVKPMRKDGDYIVLAVIGPKSSVLYQIIHQSWDQDAINEISNITKLPILYRAKPNNNTKYNKLPGSQWSDPNIPLEQLLEKAYAVVTRHSNVAVDGIIAGVPCFVKDGVCLNVGLSDLSKINQPKIISHSEQLQFCYDLAYTQWTLSEMVCGKPWVYLKSESLI